MRVMMVSQWAGGWGYFCGMHDIGVEQQTLLQKYNVPVPRYTSYPTVPYWQEGFDVGRWPAEVAAAGRDSKGISLYLHLPFCESLCTYCGCNKRITRNHSVEEPYIAALHQEWALYRAALGGRPVLQALHLGGGTPTFFSAANLELLLRPILEDVEVPEHREFSFEGHPNNTTEEHLRLLYDMGFRRVSYGVQDIDPRVQRVINRVQPVAHVVAATEAARKIGYASVNYDLVYGLPLQTVDSVAQTIAAVIGMRPDRIAYYSYAHVPWTSKGQRLYDEGDLPSAAEKLAMYELGKELFAVAGYVDVGMDHYALANDELCKAQQDGSLHRNFMGYTTRQTDALIGLGVSAISTLPGGYGQNDKTIQGYYDAVGAGRFAVSKGHYLSEEDKRIGGYILDVCCRGRVELEPADARKIMDISGTQLDELAADGLIVRTKNGLVVTPAGRGFVRNISSALDLYLIANRGGKRLFSQGV